MQIAAKNKQRRGNEAAALSLADCIIQYLVSLELTKQSPTQVLPKIDYQYLRFGFKNGTTEISLLETQKPHALYIL